MEAKDSTSAGDLHDFHIVTVLEDRAESAGPPLPTPAADEEDR
jgi:hypothetical protein